MNPPRQGSLRSPGRQPTRALLLVAVIIVAAGCAATSSVAVVQPEDPTQETIEIPLVPHGQGARPDRDLVVVSTPQDRGVLDGPVIYAAPVDDHGSHRAARPRDEHEQVSHQSEDETTEHQPPEPGEDAAPQEKRCEFEFLSEDMSSNRGNSLPPGRLQVVLFYDGDPESSPELRIGVGDRDLVIGSERAGGPIETFGRTIETREYQLSGCAPTGRFVVSGVDPNGVIDGLAFALMWRDDGGRYSMIKSNTVSSPGATYVGMWPLGFSGDTFAEVTPQISDPFGRETARALIIGSALMPNGKYEDTVPLAG